MVTLILTSSIIIALAIIGLITRDIKKHKTKYNKLILNENSAKLKLPIVSFEHKGEIYNFAIDSGASNSFIIAECVDKFEGRKGSYSTDIITGAGSIGTAEYLMTYLEHQKVLFPICFLINPHLSDALKTTEAIAGIKVHGLIGFDFLRTYGYDVDFKKMIIYYEV